MLVRAMITRDQANALVGSTEELQSLLDECHHRPLGCTFNGAVLFARKEGLQAPQFGLEAPTQDMLNHVLTAVAEGRKNLMSEAKLQDREWAWLVRGPTIRQTR